MGYFYKHNIHPYSECLKRQDTLKSYADRINLRVIHQEGYDLEGFIQNVVYRESSRCNYCYHDRLRSTALTAKRGKFDYFTSTLLFSKFQQHEMVKSIGESLTDRFSPVGISPSSTTEYLSASIMSSWPRMSPLPWPARLK